MPTVVPMVTAAFFDVDNTLVKGSSLFLIGRGLIGRGLVRRQDVARYAAVQVVFRVRGEHLGRIHGGPQQGDAQRVTCLGRDDGAVPQDMQVREEWRSAQPPRLLRRLLSYVAGVARLGGNGKAW